MSHPTDTDVAENMENNEDMQSIALFSKDNNEFSLNLSRTLARQLENMAKYEGISPTDLMLELIAEGITRRNLEDQTRPAPSHLMTRNGYVQDNPNSQPTMSHHAFQSNGNTRDSHAGGRGKYTQRHSGSRAHNVHSNRHQNSNRNNHNQNSGTFFKSNKKSET